MSDEARDTSEEATEGIGEETTEKTPEVAAEEPEAPSEPAVEEEKPYRTVRFGESEVVFKTEQELDERIREAEYLRRSNPGLGIENRTLKDKLAGFEQREQEWSRLAPLLQDEAVQRLMYAKQMGVDPALLDSTENPAIAQALGSLLPEIRKLQEKVVEQGNQLSTAAMQRVHDEYMVDNKDIADSPALQQAVADRLSSLNLPATELRTPESAKRWLAIATTLVRSEMNPGQRREQTDKAVRDALVAAQKNGEQKKKMAAVVGNGAGKTSVGPIRIEDYSENSLKESQRLTKAAMDRYYGNKPESRREG